MFSKTLTEVGPDLFPKILSFIPSLFGLAKWAFLARRFQLLGCSISLTHRPTLLSPTFGVLHANV